MTAFRQRYPKANVWLVGPTGIQFDAFFARPASACMVARHGGWQYSHTMTAITEQLETTLKRLDDRAAASLVRLVRDALELANVQRAAHPSDRLPADLFPRIAREFGPAHD